MRGSEAYNKIRPVLLCGGRGQRLSPLIGSDMPPKQFHKLDHGRGASMIETTLNRISNPAIFSDPVIFTHQDYKRYFQNFACKIYYEPARKNTFMPVFIAALTAYKAKDEMMLVLPCDHIIHDISVFCDDIMKGYKVAQGAGAIVYFGIKPDTPNTQFGYLSQDGADQVIFHEKPDEFQARALIHAGALWNSGIFLIPVARFINDIHKMAPDLCAQAFEYEYLSYDLPEALWRAAPDISFDRFYCERMKKGKIIQASFDWQDIGAPERYIDSGLAA